MYSLADFFTLQSPQALLALLALLVPLIIHLLGKSRGTLVPFAHIALIKNIKRQPMQQIRLVQRLLLFLRLMILLICALLLAQLFYSQQSSAAQKHWLISTDWLTHSSNTEKQQLAEALTGNTALVLSAPTARLSPEQIRNWPELSTPEVTASVAESGSDNLWAKIKNQLTLVPEDASVEIYATNQYQQYLGDKVHFSQPLNWHIKQIPGTASQDLPNTLNILLLYDQDRAQDITYLQAALNALQGSQSVSLSLTSILLSPSDPLPTRPVADWVIYLSSQALPAQLLASTEQGTNLLIDAAKADNMNSWSVKIESALLDKISGNKLGSPLKPQWQSSPFAASVLWHLAAQPLLTEQRFGDTRILSFYSRFNPQWNDLVISPQFPLVLATLLFDQQIQQASLQQQRLSPEQIQGEVSETASKVQFTPPQQTVSGLLGILLALFFGSERLLSEWQRRVPSSARLQQ